LADELKKALGVSSKLIAGSGGVFEVTVNGRMVFSKSEAGRFPDPGEIAGKLQKK
jgi:selT/selW/selH-like putative selenoprotein